MSILLGALLAAAAPVATTSVAAPKPAPAKPAARPTRDQVMAAVRAEWPKYDAGAKGKLTPLEFSTWVMKSHGATVAPRAHAGGIAPVSAMNASSTAFARADLNHDGGVTPDEMTRFLMTPPVPTALTKAKMAAKSTAAVATQTATAVGN
ncbi:hypothetical protein HZF05_18250 [Sphingomonas sp. CGMCC 1.13654]|uniref:EF-hand domain-containing protein n=1 Tax=Sphingomonas chungangi TaxID=2683589 RepID=A0A838LAH4_9SPHN|nr:hypothetical protein [Sphingomonas chungangi]MBA2936027.1 hypothetical protein [Sphingomonas chungangi]MVW55417.1 hypothetical protein [Sphingomonas chungangi]